MDGNLKAIAGEKYRDAHVSVLASSIVTCLRYFGLNARQLAAKNIECALESADSAGLRCGSREAKCYSAPRLRKLVQDGHRHFDRPGAKVLSIGVFNTGLSASGRVTSLCRCTQW